MQNLIPSRCRWIPLFLLAAVLLSGCSRATNSPASVAAEQKAFAGDRSQMPESEKLRIQQMQQQNAGRLQNGQALAQPKR